MRTLIQGLSACAALLGPASGTANDQALRYYDVCINGLCTGPVPVLEYANERWLLDRQALSSLGIDASTWNLQQLDGRSYADIAARFPMAAIRLDEQTQSLQIRLPAQAWPEYSISQHRRWGRPALMPSPVLSMFANYSVRAGAGNSIDGYGEAGAVFGPWLLRSDFTWDRRRGAWRSRSALEFDQPAQQRRWIAGDQYSRPGDPFGSSARMVGLGVFRAFDLTPGFATFPGADIRGEMQAPGSVDVYSGGRLVAHEQLPPGPFSLRDLSLPRGVNDLRVVVNDPFAGTYELTDSFYANPRLLKSGLHEFDDRVGRLSTATDRDGIDGNALIASFNHRYGISDSLTAGMRVESFGRRRNIGASVDLRSPWGGLASAVARSESSDRIGLAWMLAYGYERRRFALNLGLRKRSADYEALLSPSTRSFFASSVQDRYASISFPISGSARLVARRTEQRYDDGTASSNSDLDLAWRLARGIQASLRVGHRDGVVAPGYEFNLGIRVNLARDSLDIAFRRQGDLSAYQASMQRSAPIDRGWGYRASVEERDSKFSGQVNLEWVSPFGRSLLRLASLGSRTDAEIYHSGGLLWAEGQVFATQLGGQGYAIVKTSLPGIPVLRENLLIARSNERGIALIPGLLPYLANAISVDTSGLAADVRFDDERMYTSVSRQGVSVLEFKMRKTQAMQAFLGIRAGGGFRRLKSGQAQFDQTGQVATIGHDGQVYLEDVGPGRHRIHASSEGKRFACDVDVPVDGKMVWLGEIACKDE